MRDTCGRRVSYYNQHAGSITDEGDVPWFDQMCNGEDDAENDAKTANDDVCDAEEGVLAAHDRSGGDED